MPVPRRRKGERVLGPRRRVRGRTVDWLVELKAPDGSRVTRCFASENEALEFKAAAEAEIVTEVLTIGYAVEQFLADKTLEGLKPGSVETYRYALTRFFDNFQLPLWRLTEEWGKRRYEQLRREIANDTHRNYLAQAKTFCRWCAARRWLPSNPLESIRGVGKRKRGKTQLPIGHLIKWDRKAHELAAQGDVGAVAALFALWLGERASEIVAVQTAHVVSLHRPADTLQIPDSKTPNGVRVLTVAEPLSDYIATSVRDIDGDGYLFASEKSKTGHRARGWPRKQVLRICSLAGVPPVSAHAMRGSNATVGAAMGMSSMEMARALGHGSPLVTEQVYAEPGSFELDRRRGLLHLLKGGKS